MRWARAWLGWDTVGGKSPAVNPDPAAAQRERAAQKRRAEKRQVDAAADAERRQRQAQALWLDAERDLKGTPVDRYLAGRGIALARLAELGSVPAALRFAPALPYEGDRKFPALVAAVSRPPARSGDCSIHIATLRIYLALRAAPDRTWPKAPVETVKKALGSLSGGAIYLWRGQRLDPKSGELRYGRSLSDLLRRGPADVDEATLLICEGIEDGLTAALAHQRWRIWAGVSLAAMRHLLIPACFNRVVFAVDNDPETHKLRNGRVVRHPARVARDHAIAAWQRQGKAVLVAEPPKGAKDLNEMHLKGADEWLTTAPAIRLPPYWLARGRPRRLSRSARPSSRLTGRSTRGADPVPAAPAIDADGEVRRRGPPLELPPDCPVQAIGRSGTVYYLIDATNQFKEIPVSQFNQGMIEDLFAPQMTYLKAHWASEKGKSGGYVHAAVRQAILTSCAKRNLWNPNDSVRGTGAWLGDDGELIMHLGDALELVDLAGGRWSNVPPGKRGLYVYPAGIALGHPAAVGTGATAGKELYRTLQSWTWKRGAVDAALMLGWIGAAVLGGALPWRPMAWVTGDAASGKSKLHELVNAIFGRQGIVTTSDTSPAGIWQKIGHRSIPVAIDELEANADNRRVAGVIELARAAASGAMILRGGSDHKGAEFTAKSCFLFSSIYIPSLESQDIRRMAILDLEAAAENDRRRAVHDRPGPLPGYRPTAARAVAGAMAALPGDARLLCRPDGRAGARPGGDRPVRHALRLLGYADPGGRPGPGGRRRRR